MTATRYPLTPSHRTGRGGLGPLALIVVAGLLCPLQQHAQAEESSMEPGWTTPKRHQNLRAHPRLFVSAEQIERMVQGRGEDFATDYARVEAAAETALLDTENPMADIDVWSRGTRIQGRLTALAIQWHRTQDRRYLDAALETVDAIKAWMLPKTLRLAEGQFIAGVAVTYDLLYNDLTPQQRAWMVEVAREHFAQPFLRTTAPRDSEQRVEGEVRSWWMDSISNWNPVSITGGGLLALAMYEDLPEAQTMLDRVHASYQPIFDYLAETKGGWVEGLGYWNWTAHYMSLFGISYERATGEEHAGFRSPGFRETLSFGTYFVPHGEPSAFADNRHGRISHSLRAAAVHLGYSETLLRLQDHALRMREASSLKEAKREAAAGDTAEDVREAAAMETDDQEPVNIGYRNSHRLLIAPDPITEGLAPQANMTKHYPKQGWGMLADQWPKPTIYAAVRGGELGGAHTHRDLLSWVGVVGIEKMIDDCGHGHIGSATYGQRGDEIYERSSAAKNTLFIGGLPPSRGRRGQEPRAETQAFQLSTGPVLRLDASRGFWLGRGNPQFVARLFTVIEDKGLLVLDRVIGRADNPVEVRTYTRKDASFGERDVLLQGEFETARMTFAADVPAILRRAEALITNGNREPPVMMRWQTQGTPREVTMASFLSRGEAPVELSVASDETTVTVTLKSEQWQKTIVLTPRLLPVE